MSIFLEILSLSISYCFYL